MEKIDKLKKIFIKEKIDGYIIPKNDEFFLEYVAEEKDRQARKFADLQNDLFSKEGVIDRQILALKNAKDEKNAF